jgi:tetratricopeptide (TPR) repeat protein
MGVHLERARVLFYDGHRYDLAERELREELAVEPNQPLALALLGSCLARRGQVKAGLRELRQAVALAPHWAFLHLLLAQTLREAGLPTKAEASLREALRLDPGYVDAYASLARLHYTAGRYTKALTAARQGLRLNPEHDDCTTQEASALLKLGRLAEADRAISTLLRRDPESVASHAVRGWVLLEQARRQAERRPWMREWITACQPESAQALDHFREVLRRLPDDSWGIQGLRSVLLLRSTLRARLLALALLAAFTLAYVPLHVLWPEAVWLPPGRFLALTCATFVALFGALAFWTYTIGLVLLCCRRLSRLTMVGREGLSHNGVVGLLLLALLAAVAGALWDEWGGAAGTAILFVLATFGGWVFVRRFITGPSDIDGGVAGGALAVLCLLFTAVRALMQDVPPELEPGASAWAPLLLMETVLVNACLATLLPVKDTTSLRVRGRGGFC